jgi:hypothetical protein
MPNSNFENENVNGSLPTATAESKQQTHKPTPPRKWLDPVKPHFPVAISSKELLAHCDSVSEGCRSDDNLRFERFHFAGSDEAFRFCEALKADGGFGVVINQSVRIVSFWKPKVMKLLPSFEIGSLQLSECDFQYSEPRFHVEHNELTRGSELLGEGSNRPCD